MRISASRNVVLHGVPAWAGFEALNPLSRTATSVTIYAIDDQPARGAHGGAGAHWIMRKAAGHEDTVTSLEWADSRTCALMISVLNRMSDLAPIRIEVPELRPRAAPMPAPFDGTTFIAWSRAGVQPGGAYGTVDISSNDGPIADFGRYASKTLASCWREEEPLVSSPARP